jgi:hypothetical protein
MELLPKEILEKLPKLYETENQKDPLVICKFFSPTLYWHWYAIEGSPVDEDGFYDTDKEKVDYLFFGLVVGEAIELGYFSLKELETTLPYGLAIERDLYFEQKPLSEVKKLHQA